MNFKSEIWDTWDGLIFLGVGLFMGFTIYAGIANLLLDDMRKEAVERNAAEWVVDQATGETTFEWKEVNP